MCGIVGVFGNILYKHEKAFADLLVMDSIRGFDSVGVAAIGWKPTPVVLKDVVHPAAFIALPEFGELMKGSFRGLIGHNRAATKGTVVKENAHPFQHGCITGVHNGTLTSQELLDDHTWFDVDSDNLYHHLNKNGVEDMWSKMCGAASLVWWNDEDCTINFLRNKERPMFTAYSKDRTSLIFGSEPYMLVAAAHRQGIELLGIPEPTKVNELMTFTCKELKDKTAVLEPRFQELAPCTYVPRVQYRSYGAWDRWDDIDWDNYDYRRSFQDQPRRTSATSGGNVVVLQPDKHAAVGNKTTERAPWAGGGDDSDSDPSFLRVGHTLSVMFDDVYGPDRSGLVTFSGFCPQDDRINVKYTSMVGSNSINSDGTVVYEATITNVMKYNTRVGTQDLEEWHVKVMAPILKYDPEKSRQSYKDRKKMQIQYVCHICKGSFDRVVKMNGKYHCSDCYNELAKEIKLIGGDLIKPNPEQVGVGQDTTHCHYCQHEFANQEPMFSLGGGKYCCASCETLASSDETESETLQLDAMKASVKSGYFTTNHGALSRCDWCGRFYQRGENIFITETGSMCKECHDYVTIKRGKPMSELTDQEIFATMTGDDQPDGSCYLCQCEIIKDQSAPIGDGRYLCSDCKQQAAQ